jgi:broad specificity phosphatase PhoE
MTVLLLARHGETDWTRSKRWQGHGDPPLNERGRKQARTLADTLADVSLDAIYSSDLRRAAETAAIVAARHELVPLFVPKLRENDFGDWTGLTREEVEHRFPLGALLRKHGGKGWNGGESYDEMAERVVRAARAIADAHTGGRVLVVTHNGPIRAIHAHALGVRYSEYRKSAKSIKKGSVSAVTLENGVWSRVASGLRGLSVSSVYAFELLVESPAFALASAVPI